MRICTKCLQGRWQGTKKDGKFVCADCLAKKDAEAKKDEEPEE